MGDKATLAKAKKELEELYLGVPDDSVNLTFQDLAEVRQLHSEKKKTPPMDHISESRSNPKIEAISLAKIPSLDFNKALEVSSMQQNHHRSPRHVVRDNHHASSHHRPDEGDLHTLQGHHGVYTHGESPPPPPPPHHHGRSAFYDDVSQVSDYSVTSMNPYHERAGGRRRPGIPHSNNCTVCSTYIYFFRHRCLVCGRVYCRRCVNIGMGEMALNPEFINC